MSHRTRVIYTDPGGRGWASVEVLARLLAEHLDAELLTLSTRPRADRLRRATGGLPRRRSAGTCIVIAPQPAHLGSLLTADYLLRGYDRVVGWVVDSFLDDRIPRMARHHGHFDQLFITDVELVGTWAAQTGTPTSWLPFGSDVLAQPDMPSERPVDLMRVGRQPEAWDDDDSTAQAAKRLGIRFSPGPPLNPDPARNQADLREAMSLTKLTLSFTNLVSPAVYTHATRDYVTGRWTEALASGAAVAGVAPQCEAGQRLLWEDGLVRLPGTDREAGLQVIADAARDWSPEKASAIHLEALCTLDWRHRFRELAAAADLRSARLDDELARLGTRIAALSNPHA